MGVKPIGDKPLQPSKKRSSSSKGSDKEFGDLLRKTGDTEHPVGLQDLFDDIDRAADDLLERRGEENLKAYRKKVREFLKAVLDETREVKVIIRDNIYDDPLVIVKIVDKQMDEIAGLIIREEIERSELMRILEEIKGILVDLYS